MLQLLRLVIALSLLLGLQACGYKPLYATGGGRDVAADLSMIDIPPVPTREGQIVRNRLLSTMRPVGQAGANRYKLVLATNVEDIILMDKGMSNIKRAQFRMMVDYELFDNTAGKVLKSGKSFSVVSYDRVYQPFADLQSLKNATDRAALEVSNDIRTKLAAYMSSKSS